LAKVEKRRPTSSQTTAQAEQPARPVVDAATQEPSDDMSVARRVAWWSLLAIVFLVPIAMSNFTVLGFQLPYTADQFDLVKVLVARVLSLLALAAWAWDLLRRGGKVRRTPVDWAILAFLAWVTLTTITSIHWPTALFGKERRYEGLLSFMDYALIYFLVLQFADKATRVRRLAQSLFWSSVIVAGYGVLQFIGWDPVDWGELPFEAHRAFATYGNPDLLGGFLVLSVPIALGLALVEQRLAWRLVYWVGFGLNGLALIVAFTRGAWIGGFVGLLLVAIVAWRQRARMRVVDWMPAGVSAALGAGVIWRSLSSTNEVMNFGKRFASIFQLGGGSGQTRTEIWKAAFAAVKASPVLGWGADTFRLVFPKFKPLVYVRDAGSNSVADNAHNYPLQLAAGVGIPGMLLLYGVFVWAGVRSFRTVFGRSGDSSRTLVGAFWAAAAGYLVMLLSGLSVTGNTFLLWAALAVTLAPTSKVVEVRAPRWGTAAAVAAAAVLALGIGFQALPLLADHAYLLANVTADGPARTAAAKRAVQLNPFDGMYRVQVGLAYEGEVRALLATGAQAQKKGQDTTPYASAVRDRFVKAEAAFIDALRFTPDEYDYYVALATFYNLGGEIIDKRFYTGAIEVAHGGIAVERYGPAIRIQLARALLATGNSAEAVAQLEYCLEMNPANGEAALPLALAYGKAAKAAEALAVLKTAEALLPGQPGVAEAIKKIEASATPAP
jgi:O-antigen ligase/tetratricopeptide (TPR) repeat protein